MTKPLSATLVREWHPTKNQGLTASGVTCGSHRKVWWKCHKGHEWEAVVYSRSSGRGCPYCSSRRVCSGNCLASINPILAAEWHHEKNEDLTPEKVTTHSHKVVWWLCDKGHEWKSSIYNRARSTGCPYCAGQKVCTSNSLAAINPKLSAEWNASKNANLTPEAVTARSNKRVWWQCQQGHEWSETVCGRARGNGCPYCSNHRVLPETCLATVNPELALEWHPTKNGDLTPEMVTVSSGKKVWWQCSEDHVWAAAVSSRSTGSGCMRCSGGQISKVSQRWLDLLGVPTEYREYSIKLPGRKRGFRVDGFDPQTNTVYEFLGDFWHGNPKKFDQEEVNPCSKRTFGSLYRQTMRRFKRLKEAGYDVFFIWEGDFKDLTEE